MEAILAEILNQRSTFYKIVVPNMEQSYEQFNDEELKKIRKHKRQKKIAQLEADNKEVLVQKLQKFLKDAKASHVDAIISQKKLVQVSHEKEKYNAEKTSLRNQIQTLQKLKESLFITIKDKQKEQHAVSEQEKLKKTQLIDGFQAEIKEIQEKMEKVAQNKHMQEQENKLLIQREKEIEEHMAKRAKLFDEELLKIQTQKLDREKQIETQIAQIAQTMGTNEIQEDKKQQIKEEEALVDLHLNPYQAKHEEFTKITDQTHEQFNLYKAQMEKLTTQQISNEKKIQEYQKQCEKNDIYLIDIVKEHKKLQEELQKKKKQLEMVENLLASVQIQ